MFEASVALFIFFLLMHSNAPEIVKIKHAHFVRAKNTKWSLCQKKKKKKCENVLFHWISICHNLNAISCGDPREIGNHLSLLVVVLTQCHRLNLWQPEIFYTSKIHTKSPRIISKHRRTFRDHRDCSNILLKYNECAYAFFRLIRNWLVCVDRTTDTVLIFCQMFTNKMNGHQMTISTYINLSCLWFR